MPVYYPLSLPQRGFCPDWSVPANTGLRKHMLVMIVSTQSETSHYFLRYAHVFQPLLLIRVDRQ
jgi:hypothetical protein